MTECGILFSAPMVRALLDGSKTQTRRIMRPQPEPTPADYQGPAGHWWPSSIMQSMVHVEQELQNRHGGWGGFCPDCCPHGRIGDRLWVRETWAPHPDFPESVHRGVYRADPECKYDVARWRPSIHMPRWASRILLEITGVRVERLQDINDQDAIAEGIGLNPSADGVPMTFPNGETVPRATFRCVWESINGAGSWDANPWLWVIEFRRIEA
jgi:hypothetical protein